MWLAIFSFILFILSLRAVNVIGPLDWPIKKIKGFFR